MFKLKRKYKVNILQPKTNIVLKTYYINAFTWRGAAKKAKELFPRKKGEYIFDISDIKEDK